MIEELKEDVEPYEGRESNRSKHLERQELSWSSRQMERRVRLDSGLTDHSEVSLRNSFNETAIPKALEFQRQFMRINSESDFEVLNLTSRLFKEGQSKQPLIRIWQ